MKLNNAILIVGNGPSVDQMPRKFWQDWQGRIIGTNRSLVVKALQGVDVEAVVIRDRSTQLWVDQSLGSKYKTLWKSSDAHRVITESARNLPFDEMLTFVAGWQVSPPDTSRSKPVTKVMKSGSVVLAAANWAWCCGVREIYLIGVDYHGGHAKMIPPFDADTRGSGGCLPEHKHVIEKEFSEAVAAVEYRCGSLVNLSQNSQLRAVPHSRKDASWIL